MQCGVLNNKGARLHVTGFREGRGERGGGLWREPGHWPAGEVT